MKILIAGHGKSGTSALYFSLEKLMPKESRNEFEAIYWVTKTDDPPNALVKIVLTNHLVPSREKDFADFDKKILIYRDYRDCIISSTLYSLFVHHTIRPIGYKHIDPVVNLLEEKEKNPKQVNFCDIIDLMNRVTERDLWDVFNYGPKRVLQFQQDYNPFLLKYEDYVSGKVEALEEYVGLGKIDHRPQLEGVLKRLGRTKGTNDWKQWFTAADVERLKPLANPFNEHFGYSLDWDIAEDPHPDPKYGSKYVASVTKHPSQQGY